MSAGKISLFTHSPVGSNLEYPDHSRLKSNGAARAARRWEHTVLSRPSRPRCTHSVVGGVQVREVAVSKYMYMWPASAQRSAVVYYSLERWALRTPSSSALARSAARGGGAGPASKNLVCAGQRFPRPSGLARRAARLPLARVLVGGVYCWLCQARPSSSLTRRRDAALLSHPRVSARGVPTSESESESSSALGASCAVSFPSSSASTARASIERANGPRCASIECAS